ncbi:30S ribosomal protein S19 [Methanocella arvoryzae]|uniref:Small ribosomal subunit protein uS19 n=1 Tax=Methanocella arvoryzae (strain DSM 22066 / NBRC 105507 / MRE50) TaxID=351160 RepID=RS19_METAR|nr:30S ribosomal protein S19 [Methanocella arvoryzae]Q0W1Y5.1 RecName: Full=Small ribosomal subunit protein uS19; AltName: Full=30S ribosomal protein S19 [Methanocella arvoryzae MRE50]CAJ37608.1 30S ribosomal protein S19P [Methanocella arvoryzae MRE50]
MVSKQSKQAGRLPKRKEEFTYRGLTIAEMKKLDMNQVAALLPARQRRKIKREFGEEHQKLLNAVKAGETKIKTHLRDMIILPEMVGVTFEIHNGKEWKAVETTPEMVGHYLGEFALTRHSVSHGSAGIGATRGSKYVPLK